MHISLRNFNHNNDTSYYFWMVRKVFDSSKYRRSNTIPIWHYIVSRVMQRIRLARTTYCARTVV